MNDQFLILADVHGTLPWWIIPPLIAAIFTFTSAQLASKSGWSRLARLFRLTSPPGGRRFRFASIAIGPGKFPVSYRQCISIHISPNGIALSNGFRLFHPPLFIPTNAISSCRREKCFFLPVTTLYLDTPPTRLRIFGTPGNAIYNHWLRTTTPNPTLPQNTPNDRSPSPI